MAVLYVSPTGDDGEEGTANFPFRTITHALRQARPGFSIQLAPGKYESDSQGGGEQFPLNEHAGVPLTGVEM